MEGGEADEGFCLRWLVAGRYPQGRLGAAERQAGVRQSQFCLTPAGVRFLAEKPRGTNGGVLVLNLSTCAAVYPAAAIHKGG
jgi:hypothetical protein